MTRLDFAGICGDVCWPELLVQAAGGTVGVHVARGIHRAFGHISVSSAIAEIGIKEGEKHFSKRDVLHVICLKLTDTVFGSVSLCIFS